MDVKNCKSCGKIFYYNGGAPICNQCKEKEEEDFKKVKEYLYENKGASLIEVAEACEVTVEKIVRYLKDGRLEISDGANVVLECEACGISIKTGRICNDCARKLQSEINQYKAPEKSISHEPQPHKNNTGMKYFKSDE